MKQSRSIRRHHTADQGMSLVELLIGIGVAAIIIFASGTMMVQWRQSERSLTRRMDIDALLDTLRLQLITRFNQRAGDGTRIPGTIFRKIDFGFYPPAGDDPAYALFQFSTSATIKGLVRGGYRKTTFDMTCMPVPSAWNEDVLSRDQLGNVLRGNDPKSLAGLCSATGLLGASLSCPAGKRSVIRIRQWPDGDAINPASTTLIPGNNDHTVAAGGLCVKRTLESVQRVILQIVQVEDGRLVFKQRAVDLLVGDVTPYAAGNTLGFSLLPPTD